MIHLAATIFVVLVALTVLGSVIAVLSVGVVTLQNWLEGVRRRMSERGMNDPGAVRARAKAADAYARANAEVDAEIAARRAKRNH